MSLYRYKCTTEKAKKRIESALRRHKIKILLQGTERDKSGVVFEFYSEDELKLRNLDGVEISVIKKV